MKIEVYGRCNADGSSHSYWEFEIDPACERVLVTMPAFVRGQDTPDVWGFLEGGRKVDATLAHHDPQLMIIG